MSGIENKYSSNLVLDLVEKVEEKFSNNDINSENLSQTFDKKKPINDWRNKLSSSNLSRQYKKAQFSFRPVTLTSHRT